MDFNADEDAPSAYRPIGSKRRLALVFDGALSF